MTTLRQVLLDSASPQVLGDAFLRAARETHAECHVVMISSGAAFTVFEGWSAYCAGKAAMDQWVRTAGAEAGAPRGPLPAARRGSGNRGDRDAGGNSRGVERRLPER